jgi:lambda family phage portal protein
MQLNILDKVVLAVAPRLGRDRLLARIQAENLKNAAMRYDGASANRSSQGWRSIGTDANAEIRSQGYKLREIARDMVRNNPYAARGVQVISEGVVGAGIIPSIETSVTASKDQMMALIKDHCDSTAIDADGRNNLYGIENLVLRGVVESGEILVRRRPRRAEDKLPLPFQLQVLEADFLDTRKDGPLTDGGFILNGVEYNGLGRRVAYHLFREHPGNVATYRLPDSSRVPAADVAHVYRMDRAGQMNGVTWFAPVILAMRDFADYEDAQLMRQKIAACFAAFITRADGGSNPLLGAKDQKLSDAGLPAEGVEPGMVMRLREGESVTFGVPPQVEGYRDFSTVTLHKIAVGLGTDYASLTGDNSQGNFANSRMGWLRYHRSVENWQWNMTIPNLCDPIGGWLLDGIAATTGRRVPAKIMWTPPRREMFDPSKEVKASIESIRGGLSSRSAEVRKLGFDPEDLDREIKTDNDRADKNGFTFSSDSRHPVNGVQETQNVKQTD